MDVSQGIAGIERQGAPEGVFGTVPVPLAAELRERLLPVGGRQRAVDRERPLQRASCFLAQMPAVQTPASTGAQK